MTIIFIVNETWSLQLVIIIIVIKIKIMIIIVIVIIIVIFIVIIIIIIFMGSIILGAGVFLLSREISSKVVVQLVISQQRDWRLVYTL